jgi:hypothetical protein
MSENSFLSRDVDLDELSMLTKNFSGAEIEGLVKGAAAFALNRQVDVNDLHKALTEDNIKVGCRGSTGTLRFLLSGCPDHYIGWPFLFKGPMIGTLSYFGLLCMH